MANNPVIAFVGYGAFAKQIEQMLYEIRSPLANASAVYFDDYAYHNGKKNAYPFSEYLKPCFNDCLYIVAIGYSHLPEKYNIVQNLRKQSCKMPSIIHPDAIISPSSTIEDGCVVFPGCVIEMNSVIQAGSVLYDGCIIAHDTTVGTCSFLAPQVTIAGRSCIGERTFLGVGSVVINDVKCGSDCVIGAASLVQKSLPSHTNGIGNPFHIIQNRRIKV